MENTIRNAIIYSVGESILTEKYSGIKIGWSDIKLCKYGLLDMTLLYIFL